MEIKNWKDRPNSGSTLSTFDVWLPHFGMTLHCFRVVRRKDGKGWFVSPPQYMEELQGTKRWLPYISFNEERKKEFDEKLKGLVDQVMASGVRQ